MCSTLEDISANIIRISRQSESSELKILLSQFAETVNTLNDAHFVIGPLTRLLPCHNLSVKKTAYMLLPRICGMQPSIALLSANTIKRDCKDPNPYIRCLAVSALCSLPPLLEEHAGPVLDTALKDTHPKVRQVAVIGCGKVYRRCKQLILDQGFVDRLYESIRDCDPLVVTSSLLVLDNILVSEGGVVINRNIAAYLINRLPDFPHPQLASVIQVLTKYKPKDENELFHELSVLDPYLVHSNAVVSVNCIKLFITLTRENHLHLKSEIIERVVPALKQFLSPASPKEYVCYVLDFLLVMKMQDMDWLTPFQNEPDLFFPCKTQSGLTITLKKLSVLPCMCTEENVKEVLKALETSLHRDMSIRKQTIKCICCIAVHLLSVAGSDCLSILISLIDTEDEELCNCVFDALENLNLQMFEKAPVHILVTKILTKANVSKMHVPYIIPMLLAEYGELVPDQTAYVLETLAQNFNLYGPGLQYLVFKAALKVFLKIPAKSQHILAEIMEKCLSDIDRYDSGHSLMTQQMFLTYYKILKSDMNLLRKTMDYTVNSELVIM